MTGISKGESKKRRNGIINRCAGQGMFKALYSSSMSGVIVGVGKTAKEESMGKSINWVRCVVLLAGVLALTSGCAHPLVVKNIDSYRAFGTTPQATEKSIGFVTTASMYSDQVILNGVADSLRRYSRSVVTPYVKGGKSDVDVVANVDLRSSFDGSGINFLIDWPGFLIWTPAWNGYVYKIKHNFSVRLEDGKSDATLDSFNIPVDLDVRHAAMNRTWLAESGWWLLWSVPALIGGIMHTEYDPNVTPLEAREIAAPIGDFVAQEIVRHIPATGSKAVSETKESKAVTEDEGVKADSQRSLDSALRELGKLKEDGLITQDEFDAKKKSLLEKY